jgi:hypothetical protein
VNRGDFAKSSIKCSSCTIDTMLVTMTTAFSVMRSKVTGESRQGMRYCLKGLQPLNRFQVLPLDETDTHSVVNDMRAEHSWQHLEPLLNQLQRLRSPESLTWKGNFLKATPRRRS